MNMIAENIYLVKVNNENTIKKCKICPKLTKKTPERHYGVFFVKIVGIFEHPR